MIQVKNIVQAIHSVFPPALQEEYDNVGLLIGDENAEVSGLLLCVDVTIEIIEEAVSNGVNTIVAHHPLIFKGVKKITQNGYVNECIYKAIQGNLNVISAHTNVDNHHQGVSFMMAEKLGLHSAKVLLPKKGYLKKLQVFVPSSHVEVLSNALFRAGMGNIGNYAECSFRTEGIGTFLPNDQAKPFVGVAGSRSFESEISIEGVFQSWQENAIVQALRSEHPYEEIAFFITSLENEHTLIGSGMIGSFDRDIVASDFLNLVHQTFQVQVCKHTQLPEKIRKVALCGGTGSFLIGRAKQLGADVFLTSDVKYHEYFEAEKGFGIIDIGHYEAEQYTKEIFFKLLSEKFPNIATHKSKVNTNPVLYSYKDGTNH